MLNAECRFYAIRRADSPDETLYGHPIGCDPACRTPETESAPTGGTGRDPVASGGGSPIAGGQGRDAEEIGNSAMVIVWMVAAACFWAIAAAVWWMAT